MSLGADLPPRPLPVRQTGFFQLFRAECEGACVALCITRLAKPPLIFAVAIGRALMRG